MKMIKNRIVSLVAFVMIVLVSSVAFAQGGAKFWGKCSGEKG